MLGFIPYRWMMYKADYYGKTRDEIKELKISSDKSKKLLLQLGIFGILRTVFLKRMESSVSALASSLETYSRKLDLFEQGINEGRIVSMDDLDALESSLGDEDVEVDEKALVDALNNMDLPVVMGSVLTIASLFVIINILVDLIYGWLDPRIRIQ